MRSKTGKSVAESSALDLAHGNRKIPPAVLRSATVDVNGHRMEGIVKEKVKLYRTADKYLSKLQQPIDIRDPAVAHTIEGLRGVSDGLAKRKVIAPAVSKRIPGILAGSYSIRLTPGYDFGQVSSFPHDTRNSAFVHRGSGAMGFNIFAQRKDADAVAFVSLGAFFIPMFGPARLRASVNPSLSFAQWAISTGSAAITLALMDFRISVFRPDGSLDLNVHPTSSGTRTLWFNQIGIGLDFDFGSPSDNQMTAAVEVDTGHFYLITLECLGQAFSFGGDKPGFTSSAGGILNLTLPNIDLDLQLIPVASQAV